MPIPGMRSENRIRENLSAADVVLTQKEYTALCAELSKISVYGSRDGKDIAKLGTVPKDTVR